MKIPVFDVIVVGGGAAGCLLAGRLAAETDASILLLEAGEPDNDLLIHIPAGYSKILAGNKHVFPYETVPQRALNGRAVPVQQGKCLGGGGSVNALCTVRGQPDDYARWDQAANGEGRWSYKDVLAHFRSMEASDLFANVYHGSDGPFAVSQPPHVNALNQAVIRAFQQVGLPYNPDYNGETQRGVGACQLAMRDARRESAATAFLAPARSRPNLTVETRALATSLVVEGGRATGVDYARDGATHRAMAGEVVVCAGAFNSPRLLMLSGIGPEDVLAQHDIPIVVRADGVGRNLHDHPQVSVTARARGDLGYARDAHGFRQVVDGLRWQVFRDGPAASNGVESVCYFDPDEPEADPSIQCFHSAVLIESGLGAPDRHPGLTLETVLLRPQARGRMTLRDADPRSMPLIDPDYLAEPEDMRKLVAGLEVVRAALRAPALAAVTEGEFAPGPGVTTDTALEDHARRTMVGMWHPVGTCRMGADDASVVDPSLRVRGIDGLSVVDSSIMPVLTSGNTHMPTLAIASKGVDFLKRALGVTADAGPRTETGKIAINEIQ